MKRMAQGMRLLMLVLLLLGRGTLQAGEKPPAAEAEPSMANAWQRRIPELTSDGLPLEEIVKLLRQKFPEVNFLVKEKARSQSVALVLRSVTLEEILTALGPATEDRVKVVWPTNSSDRLVIFDRPAQPLQVDPNTGLPFPAAGKKICRVYNVSDYLNSLPNTDMDKAIAEIQNVLETAWKMLRDANQDEDQALPTLSVHRGTRLLVAVGRPEDMIILEQVVMGLQGSAPNTAIPVPPDARRQKSPKPAPDDATRSPSKK
jgi:hypothetical protein